jgi:TRAP-type uncharacterized transport system fused permease subunit
MRNLKAPLKWIVGVWSALIALFYLYTAVFGIMQPRIQRGVHMLFSFPWRFFFFRQPRKTRRLDRPSALDWVRALASIVPALYIIIYNEP